MGLKHGALAHRVGVSAAAGNTNPFGDYTYENAEALGWVFDPLINNYKTLGVANTMSSFFSDGIYALQPCFQSQYNLTGRVDTQPSHTAVNEHIGYDFNIKRGLHCYNAWTQYAHLDFLNGNWHKSNVTATTDGTLAAHPAHQAPKMQATGGQYSQFYFDGGGFYPNKNFNNGYWYFNAFYVKKGSATANRFLAYNDVTPAHVFGIDWTWSGTVPVIGTPFGPATDKYVFYEDLGGGWYRILCYWRSTWGSGGRYIFYPDFSGANGYTYFYNMNEMAMIGHGGSRGVRGDTPNHYIGDPFGDLIGATDYLKNQDAGWYNGTGTMLFEFSSSEVWNSINGERQHIFSFGNNVSSERMEIYLGKLDGTESQMVLRTIRNSVAYYMGSSLGTRTRNQFYRIAMRYGLNDFAVSVDGVMRILNTTNPMPFLGTGANLGFGGNGFGNNSNLDGQVRQAAHWPSKASNADLNALSNPANAFEPA